MVKSFTQDTFSRWMWQGVPLLIGVGVLVVLTLRLGCALPFSTIAIPMAILIGLQILSYPSMYPIRKRFRQTRDLRPGFALMGLYCLFVGLTGMYYAGKLGIVPISIFEDNSLAFSIFVIVVVSVGLGGLSFLKRIEHS